MRARLSIISAGLKESRRDRVFFGLFLALGLFDLVVVWLGSLVPGSAPRVMFNAGMAALSLLSLLLTILYGSFALHREEERRELYVILNRIGRPAYLQARFGAIALLLLLFNLLGAGLLFALILIFTDASPWPLFWMVLFNFCEFTLLAAVAVFFYAAGINFSLATMLVIAVFLAGHSMSEARESFIALGVLAAPAYRQLVETITYLMPNFDLFDFHLDIVHGRPLPPLKVGLALGYWLAYTGALLLAGGALFKRRDL